MKPFGCGVLFAGLILRSIKSFDLSRVTQPKLRSWTRTLWARGQPQTSAAATPVKDNDTTIVTSEATNQYGSSSISSIENSSTSYRQQQPKQRRDDLEETATQVLASHIATCLIQSDHKRDTGLQGTPSGWTSWVDDAAAYDLQQVLDKIGLVNLSGRKGRTGRTRASSDDEELTRWISWIKSCPGPLILDATPDLRNSVTMHVRSVPGAMIFGKLLVGGVTRFRLLGNSNSRGINDLSKQQPRRAGERTVVVSQPNQPEAGWLQYGGPQRCYQAIDMGPCLLMEVVLLPKSLQQQTLEDKATVDPANNQHETMGISILRSVPLLRLLEICDPDQDIDTVQSTCQAGDAATIKPAFDVGALESDFCSSIGGLRPQISEIVRRVLDGRVIRPVSEIGTNVSHHIDAIRRDEMEGLLQLGLQPVRGLLLYGPPGCGKTALAREISKILDAREPKIVAAPELLDRWVGGSEKLVRDLFAEAELELRQCQGDPTMSALHVVVLDEIDAVFRKRSAADSTSEATRASVTNQILAKLDGVNALGNVLVIGMTNRKELLDPALLRPGRLEVHIEIPMPNHEGRREIMQIQFGPLRRSGRLSRPLCDAIDGVASRGYDTGEGWLPSGRLRFLWRKEGYVRRRISDLASDRWTGGFSGADIAGLVRCAGSIALARSRKQDGSAALSSLVITIEDMVQALKELRR